MPKPNPKKIATEDIPRMAEELVRTQKFPMLATMDEDQPRVRPISPVRTDRFTVYVANLRTYHKTVEIEANSKVELCYLDSDHNQVRITGSAEELDDRQVLEEIWNHNRLLEHYLGNIDNPDLIIYVIKPTQVRFMQEWALNYHEVQI